MQLTTVIFDMDGLLIDSEPLWCEAATEIFKKFGIQLTPQQYAITTGLRTKDFIAWWFSYYKIHEKDTIAVEKEIVNKVIELVIKKGKPLPGLSHIFNFFIDRKFNIGLASSSPAALIDVVVDLLQIRNHLQASTSASNLKYGKPHPEVYLNCAAALKALPAQCLCFEDSFNGIIAAKAARMKCVVVPEPKSSMQLKWNAADLKISSLQNFTDLLLQTL